MVLSESTRLSEEAKAPGCIYADRNQLKATIKTSIAPIVAETRRTVGRLACGAAAQARRVITNGGGLRSVTQTSATIYPDAPRGEQSFSRSAVLRRYY